ncbi:MAG: tyrosine-protein phosphatase [Bifidobacteriaceae bacterium]|nr:tyrosine-protein phosphatase [Bifidobacteriaceae bacterium]
MPARDVLIEGTWNARVFGDEHPWLLRSATLDGLTDRGRTTLDRLGVRAVIDLREPGERRVPGHNLPTMPVPVFGRGGGGDPRVTMEVAYRLWLEAHGVAMVQAVRLIAQADGPVAVHCAIGKDRTGLVVALALLAAGYSRDVIVGDYAASASRQPSFLRRTTLERMAWEGIEAETPAGREYLRRSLDSPGEVISGALDYLEINGGWWAFLEARGLTETEMLALRAKAGLLPVAVPYEPLTAVMYPECQVAVAAA